MGEPLVSSWFLIAETMFQLRIPNSSIYTQVSILPMKKSREHGQSVQLVLSTVFFLVDELMESYQTESG
jgi:hypothetical protein